MVPTSWRAMALMPWCYAARTALVRLVGHAKAGRRRLLLACHAKASRPPSNVAALRERSPIVGVKKEKEEERKRGEERRRRYSERALRSLPLDVALTLLA